MADKIKLSELLARIERGDLPKDEANRFFELDPAASRAFLPRFRLNADAVDVRGLERFAEEGGNRLALEAGRSRIATAGEALIPAAPSVSIIAEGDSWFSHPLVTTAIEALQESGVDIVNLASAGDTMEEMLTRRQYMPFLQTRRVSHFLFSGGGNDVLENLRTLLRRISFEHEDPNNPAHVRHYLTPEVGDMLKAVVAKYATLLQQVRSASPSTVLVVHGYAHARPAAHGPFLGDDFEFLGFELAHKPAHLQLARAIVREMVDRFNVALETFAHNNGKVVYCDLRPVIRQDRPGDWFDTELHPSSQGARKIAARLARELPQPPAPAVVAGRRRARPARREPA